ncbi:hypothetical protein EDEG_03889 [Edhazardia aedis USNM 41457]|uniref:Uncharacterized protein n=1 Tax=Edhazardia aedis (strain USNM 41457) TaxID=1003232 RepID=J9DG35_EDHAE|nr:hypothetical protein EDEG_03889 [Edhazardia aedis USNM 41457]|eukprot:EJW01545.1 hypothetical protein EDEG_03889 [Edhazardia aedis USNM 41457]
MDEILFELITTGISITNNRKYDFSKILEELRLLNYSAQEWYDNSEILLIDKEINPESKENLQNQMELITRIVDDANIDEDEITQLIHNGWVEKISAQEKHFNNNHPHVYKLSKRFLIQYKDYLKNNFDSFNDCKLCGILVNNDEYHSYCRGVIRSHTNATKNSILDEFE